MLFTKELQMKPGNRGRYAAAITLSKGKMYEYGVEEIHHLDLPENLDLEMQFPLAIGTIGDFASESVSNAIGIKTGDQASRDEVIFSAQVLQAFDDSRLNEKLAFNLRLLAAAGFYLGDVPGNAAVQIKKLDTLDLPNDDSLALAIKIAIDRPWNQVDARVRSFHAAMVLAALEDHFKNGQAGEHINEAIRNLRLWAYSSADSHELLMADILGAVSATRIANSGWTLLPRYSELTVTQWQTYLARHTSIKEMWPSQRLLGEAGLYRGSSGIVQMPTSSGKSRATELVIRSAFLSSRTKLALVVAPFRALCQEITNDLEAAFLEDGYSVNQLSDALQSDLDFSDIFDIFEITIESKPQVVILTPEKLLYVLRQEPKIVEQAGLIVYDEGHQFDTGTRGVTYELLLTSIKRLLSENAQTVLISAVIQNAAALANWLLRDASRVVSDKSLQARRLIAFASLPSGKDGQLQFNATLEGEQQFFVPRVLVQEKQRKLPRERTDRFFPTAESGSIALYLALRLVSNGGVAIYAGKKASASKIVRDAVQDTFRRGISLLAPSSHSDPEELRRFVHLFNRNFGTGSYLTLGVALGIFAHHGNTPHGVRLAIEHAMRRSLIRLIVCTSTLAQGVNLPIRYLLVTSPMQGRESIKARDFHNLMGRAGRAGMYGEGTVIFTDHRLYDERYSEPRRWTNTVGLIDPEGAGPTGSTLLSLFDPMRNDTGTQTIENPSPANIATSIVDNWDGLYSAIANLSQESLRQRFSVASLREQLEGKRRIIEAIESFLMTYRSDLDFDAFVVTSRTLASETFAFSLATLEQQAFLSNIFESVARRIERLVPRTEDQQRFGRTLLGINYALAVETWVKENMSALVGVESSDALFDLVWPVLAQLSTAKKLSTTTPVGVLKDLAKGWLAGRPFVDLLGSLSAAGATYAYGQTRRLFDVDLVVDLCEQTFGFEFALFLAAVKESFVANITDDDSEAFESFADLLQKRLKYGLPSQDCISYFEAGFSERVVAQAISSEMFWETAESSADARRLVREHANDVEIVLDDFPSYFLSVLRIIVASQT